ncbi:MAG: WD40 repeat domain-containing protein [Treponema sp.]|nr:WD40 repeat domain-containing protein [Treponema sp.]
MKKIITVVTLLAGISLNLFAQREIPMFFDRELGLVSHNIGFWRQSAYSSDGSRIAATFQSNKIVIWDAANGREITRMAGHNEPVSGIIFSPNGRQLVSTAGRDSAIKIWDAVSGQLLRSISQSGIANISFSADGSFIAGTGPGPGNNAKIWNVSNGNEIRTLTGHTGNINSVAYSPNGRQILTASNDRSIKIWDAGSGQCVRTINCDSPVENTVYNPNGRQIAAAIDDYEKDIYGVRIYNAETGQELRFIPVELYPYDLVYSPDGKQLFVNAWINDGNTKTIKIFDPDTGRVLRSLNNENNAFAFSPDGRMILTDSKAFELKAGNTYYGASYASLLDATTGRTVGTIGYGPLNVGAKAFADLPIARFLGDSAAVSRNEEVLKFITDRGYAARTEVEAFYRDNVRALIAGAVNEEFNKISFGVRISSPMSYDCVLSRNAQNGYVLSYNSYFGTDTRTTREVSGASLDALSSAMSRSGDFPAAAINTVKEQTELLPAAIYARRRAGGNADALALVTDALVNFFANPTPDSYRVLLGIEARYARAGASEQDAHFAFWNALSSLSRGLRDKIVNDPEKNSNQAYRYPADPRYDVFLGD